MEEEQGYWQHAYGRWTFYGSKDFPLYLIVDLKEDSYEWLILDTEGAFPYYTGEQPTLDSAIAHALWQANIILSEAQRSLCTRIKEA